MRTFKLANLAMLTLSAVVLLIMITYAYGAATMSSSSSPSSLSSSSSPMRSGQRRLSHQDNGDFNVTAYKNGGGSRRKGGSKPRGGNKRKGGSKPRGGNKRKGVLKPKGGNKRKGGSKSKGGNKRKGGSRRKGGSKKNKWNGGKNSQRQSTTNCECGEKLTTRIIGGVPTTKHEYPWQVAVYTNNAQGKDDLCGGTLINNRFVLTAAHCVATAGPDNVTVHLRVHNRNKPNQPTERSVSQIIIHKDFVNTMPFRNDIALLEFDEKIDFKDSASPRPICLPETKSKLYVGDTAIATGWGLTDPNNTISTSDVLMEVELQVVSEHICRLHYNDGDISTDHICAGNGNMNTCGGDSGGPLAFKNNKARYEQIGITSFNFGDCGVRGGEPAVFTRVNKYLPWIKKKTESAKYCKGFTFP